MRYNEYFYALNQLLLHSMKTIKDIISDYQAQVSKAQVELSAVRSSIYRIGTMRLILFVAGIVGFFYFIHTMTTALLVLTVAMIPFILLIKVHNRFFRRKDYLEQVIKVNEQEQRSIDYDPTSFDEGKEYIDSSHPFSFDIDIFGKKSLFQYCNRSVTPFGREWLADCFIHPLDQKKDILRRQEAIKELSGHTTFRQEFRVRGLLYKGSASDGEEITRWNKTENYFNSRQYYHVLKWLVPAINLILFVLAFFGIIGYTIFGFGVMAFILLSIGLTQHISKVQSSFEKKLHILSTYATLLKLIEDEPLESEELNDVRGLIVHDDVKASWAIHHLTLSMNALDQRNNILVTALLNGLFFWELHQIMKIEQWKDKYGGFLPQWLECISRFDALCSLSTYAYNNPSFVYPSISDTPKYYAEALKHPLMNREVCVPNGMAMEGAPHFHIVTGANMAGKSTYLRTVGINHLLACMGMPVDALKMDVYPAHLMTSLRTSDSLTDNESYFFAELKRLKMVVDKLQSGEHLFIILDEILRGTNSVDKQKGSYSFLKKITLLGATGLIATHDLQLAQLKEAFPQYIDTKCFEADITDNELVFSYRLRDGVARNMNACFLMKKMGIMIEE